MTSNECFVWVWLPQQAEPTAAGVLQRQPSGDLHFRYGTSYLEREDAISLYSPTLPLRDGWIEPPDGWNVAPNLRDAGPDGWGQRVILDRLTGQRGRAADVGDLDDLAYFRESNSNRSGGLDFQDSPHNYVPRDDTASLDALYDAATALDDGQELTPALRAALESGTGIGGARPKAIVRDGEAEYVAKFTSSSDTYPVIQAEAAAMFLAREVGMDVPTTRVVESRCRKALLSERFDRTTDGGRRIVISGLTMSGLTEMAARHGSYPDLLDTLRTHGAGDTVGRDLFQRVAFNMAITNNDDHLRNHAAFWDGQRLTLTPAYDLSPGTRSGDTMTQAIAYGRNGERATSLAALARVARDYGLTEPEARDIIDHTVAAIDENWADAAEHAKLTATEADRLYGTQFLHRSIFYDYGRHLIEGVNGPEVSVESNVDTGVQAYPTAKDINDAVARVRAGEAAQGAEHWVQPHLRDGKPVQGHWSKNPGHGGQP